MTNDRRRRRTWWLAVLLALLVFLPTLLLSVLGAQTRIPVPLPLLATLHGVAVPEPPNLGEFVANRAAAIALGKALFWDIQVGSQGQACASCHFNAGADTRRKNQLNPNGNNRSLDAAVQFDVTASGGGGPNYTLKAADFPFHQLEDPNDRDSFVLFDSDDVVSSQGVFATTFTGAAPFFSDQQRLNEDRVYQVKGIVTRRVEPRNSPTVINAIFNFRNFWDGRANNHFNGVTPFGGRDRGAHVLAVEPDGSVHAVAVDLPNGSAASQAVGPPLSFFEMSASGRTWHDIGRKLMTLRPLALQAVSSSDSVLAPYRDKSKPGLKANYRTLIRQAFTPRWWNAAAPLANGYTVAEENFSLFFGIAIQLYEATLVSDDSPFDRFMRGDTSALTGEQRLGKILFETKGRCVECHRGPELTAAGSTLYARERLGALIERMRMGEGSTAIYDSGFYNIGVAPTENDIGVGGTDPWGNPLSFTRQFAAGRNGAPVFDPFFVVPCTFAVDTCFGIDPGAFRDAIDGTFKTPTLRNVELTGPYFHTGGYATLASVVAFYNRGGNRQRRSDGDTSGFGDNPSNADVDIEPLNLTAAEQAALVAFLKSLTDERVRWEKAPFDHPALTFTNGHPGNQIAVSSIAGRAVDTLKSIPAVGAKGRTTTYGPISPFSPR